MKTKLLSLIIFCLLFSINSLFAQQIKNEAQKPIYVGAPTKVEQVPSIASRTSLARPVYEVKEMMDGRASKYDIVPGKGSDGPDALAQNQHRLTNKIPTRAPLLVFETGASGSQPTDPAGAVGPNHYISVINTAFQIFDKNGNSLTGGLVSPNPTIFPSGGCCDLTASYDNAADRWVLTFLGSGAQIAVSNGPDPVNDGWTTYTYAVVNDYQKLSVWSDGYYMTENTGASEKIHVFDRTAMLAGNTSAAIQSFAMPGLVTSGFHSAQVLNISDGNTPALGSATVVYMQDDAWTNVTNDHLKLWEIDIDWNTPSNSQISAAIELGAAEGVTPFVSVFDGGSFSNLPQPSGGSTIDALQATVMNQAQFRKFGTHNSAVFNFVVDVAPGTSKQAAVRWYELRQSGDGQPWSVYQEGTYTAPDNRHAWNASLIMDVQGNIGLGYTSMSSPNSADPNIMVGSYYSGRLNNDPLGTMTVSEEVIAAGDANIPGTRYGDYSKIDIDPDGDKKFWFVNEVMSNGRKNIAGVFQLAPNTANDVGVISVDTPVSGALTNNETVTVTVFNFGDNDASGFDVTYQVNGGTLISESFPGTLTSQTSAQYSFTATADLSIEGQAYTLISCTDLAGDEDTTNDCTTASIKHDFSNDLGVTQITSPVSGEGLTNETVTIDIQNFGAADQSGFDVSYTVNGGTPVVENVAATVVSGGTISYSFATTANLSSVGVYTISSSTLLNNDANPANDTSTISVTNFSCLTNTYTDPDLSIGPDGGSVTTAIITFTDDFIIDDVNVAINLQHTYDGDLTIKLIAPNGTTEVMLSDQNGGSEDDYTNTLFDDEATTPITNGSPPFTGSFQPQGSLSDLDGLQSLGDWTLSILDNASVDGGTLFDWSLELCGNTSLSVDDVLVQDGITIVYEENNHFLINLPTNTITDRLNMNIYTVLGQNLMWRTLENENGQGYQYRLDMSHVSAGVYFVKIGNNHASNIKRIIVK